MHLFSTCLTHCYSNPYTDIKCLDNDIDSANTTNSIMQQFSKQDQISSEVIKLWNKRDWDIKKEKSNSNIPK